MEDGFHGLPLRLEGSDDRLYTIKPFEATASKLKDLWEKAGKHSFLFTEFTEHDGLAFVKYFMQPGVIVVSAWLDEKEVGILYADKLVPGHSARVHYFFWDRVQASREPVILGVLNWFMETFDLRRVSIEVPWYAYSVLRRIHAMGLMPEGIRRKAVRYNGMWRDQIIFSVMRDQLDEDSLARGRLDVDEDTENWFGLLDSDKKLARAIFKEGVT